MRTLITGGAGFLGSNVAAKLLADGHPVAILDNLSRLGSEKNLEWLTKIGEFTFYKRDVREAAQVASAIAEFTPTIIFHFAGQVAMTTSISNPRLDFEINALGTLNLLEAVRLSNQKTSVIYSSTNKVYGDLEDLEYRETDTRYYLPQYPQGLPTTIPLEFHSPYGCSKGAADQYVLDYGRIFDIPVAVFRHSSMYGGRQFATEDQGWIGWFCSQAIKASRGEGRRFTVSGSGKQVRDVLHAQDMVDLYTRSALNMDKIRQRAFNVGGGPVNSMSVIELLDHLGNRLDAELDWIKIAPRISDQRVFVADIRDLKATLGWEPKVDFETGLDMMIDWTSSACE
jgi:CDP-paratose 2-epimerase